MPNFHRFSVLTPLKITDAGKVKFVEPVCVNPAFCPLQTVSWTAIIGAAVAVLVRIAFVVPGARCLNRSRNVGNAIDEHRVFGNPPDPMPMEKLLRTVDSDDHTKRRVVPEISFHNQE